VPALFTKAARFQSWLDVEAALAGRKPSRASPPSAAWSPLPRQTPHLGEVRRVIFAPKAVILMKSELAAGFDPLRSVPRQRAVCLIGSGPLQGDYICAAAMPRRREAQHYARAVTRCDSQGAAIPSSSR
jgi:hypothetical protein